MSRWIEWRAAVAVLTVSMIVSTAAAGRDAEMNGAAIGARLFSDTRLSADGTISCASCHEPSKAFADGRPVAIGIGGQKGVRNTPSLTTAALHGTFSWDGRKSSLESQVLAPLLNPREHGLRSGEELVGIVESAADYPSAFRSAVTPAKIALALAAYVRTLDAGQSRFDRFWFRHDKSALSDMERLGFDVFRGPGRCAGCHRLDAGASFTDDQFHSVGFSQLLADDLGATAQRSVKATPDQLERLITGDDRVAALGRFNVTRKPADIGKYRTPSLRNVALTAPYMHDGRVPTLEAAVNIEIYYRGLEQNRPLVLGPRERESLIAFLRTLTSEQLERIEGHR